jgi:predicted N-acyltransferase
VTVTRARFLKSIAEVDAASWNAVAGSVQPFLRHEFLLALEASGCAVARTGWTARHLLLEDSRGRLLAAMPLYRKGHSRGEFVFDFSWANAYAQHGLKYYPKLVTAIPFTPVAGPRLLVGPGPDAPAVTGALIQAAADYARSEDLSSWHVLFPGDENLPALNRAGLIERRDCQFHWFNQGYDSFEAFLAGFTAEKRKKAKRERRRVAEAGIEFDTRLGGEMSDALWNTVYGFYADTFYRHGHDPYLNLDFFKRIAAAMPDQLMLKIARHGREPIAVAIFFVGEDALFGRYWGAGGNFHSLHFETCYYQGIEY